MATSKTRNKARTRRQAQGNQAKPAAKATTAKAKTNGAKAKRRSHEDLMKLVPDIVKVRQGGGSWDDVISKVGVNGIVARPLLAEAGYDAKGNKVESEKITAKGTALSKRLVAEREKGTAWFTLALATGQSEDALKKLVTEAGRDDLVKRVYTKSEKPAKAAKASKASNGGSSSKQAEATKTTKRRVARKAKASTRPQSAKS